MYQPTYDATPLTEGEFVIPTDVKIMDLNADEVANLLSHTILRGFKLMKVLMVMGGMGVLVSILFGAFIPWGISSVFGFLLFGFGVYRQQMKLRLINALKSDPAQVVWAHPTILQRTGSDKVFINFITLHYRNGQKIEVSIPHDYMVSIFVWLRKNNPSIKLTSSARGSQPK